jgi:hypothetical protein
VAKRPSKKGKPAAPKSSPGAPPALAESLRLETGDGPHVRPVQPRRVLRPAAARQTVCHPYDTTSIATRRNFQPLTPLSFLERAAHAYPRTSAIIHGRTLLLCRILCALAAPCFGTDARRNWRGDTVSALLANTPAMLEAHHGVP